MPQPHRTGPAPEYLMARGLVDELILNENVPWEISDQVREAMVQDVWGMIEKASEEIYDDLADSDFLTNHVFSLGEMRRILIETYEVSDTALNLVEEIDGPTKETYERILYAKSGLRAFTMIES